MAKSKETVDEYMDVLDHPFKAEVQAIREMILAVSHQITEQVKWNAPSFRAPKDYIATFNLRPTHHVHLIFHNPAIASIKREILEGDYPDRRMVYFTSMDDVNAKRADLEYVVGELVRIMENN